MFAFPVILVSWDMDMGAMLANGTKASGVLILLQIDLKKKLSTLLQVVGEISNSHSHFEIIGYLRLKTAATENMQLMEGTTTTCFQSYHWLTLKCEVK